MIEMESVNYVSSCFSSLLPCSLVFSVPLPMYTSTRIFLFFRYLCAYVCILLCLSIPLPFISIFNHMNVSLLSIFTSGKWPSSTILSASSTIKNRMPLISRNIGISSSVISSHKRPGVATKICTGRLWLAPKILSRGNVRVDAEIKK